MMNRTISKTMFAVILLPVFYACSQPGTAHQASSIKDSTTIPTETSVSSEMADTGSFECKLSIDQMNEGPIAHFTLTSAQKFQKIILDPANRIWAFCSSSEKLDCTIGQLPAGLPDAAQNFMNVVPAARSFVDLDSKNYYLATGSYQALAGLHTNYSPEIVCKSLSK